MEVLVTGSAGFVGSHTVTALRNRNDAVRDFDIAMNEDIRNQELTLSKVKGADAVIHLAALAEVPYSFEHPSEVSDVNITGTVNLLEACRKHDVKKFVFASSSAVYGELQSIPVDEGHPLKPTTPYGLTKLVGEQFIDQYRELYGLNTACLRYFNIYGLGQKRGIVGDSLEAIKRGRPIIIFGDGKQTRDFVNVSDVVQANLNALNESVPSGCYNVGTGNETSIIEIVTLLQELSGTNLLDYRQKRDGDVTRIYANTAKARSVLNYEPIVSLRDGLTEVVLKTLGLASPVKN